MFTTFHMGHYQPLSWVSLGLDYVMWGENPWGYHLTNLLLHAANAVLVFLLARKLLFLGLPAKLRDNDSWAGDVGALIAALLFALHPLRVESVAWVTERRDVLSSFFLLATILLYLRAQAARDPRGHRRFLLSANVTFLFSLLSRAMGVTLPLILLVLDVYPLRRLGGEKGYWRRDVRPVWIEKIPFVILAAAAAVLAPIAQSEIGAAIELSRHGIPGRVAQACYGLTFYLHKSLMPLGLSPIYELRLPFDTFATRYVASAIILALSLVALVALRRKVPALAAAAICYVVFLLPVLGFVQSGPQEVADRYTYLPSIGWAILLGAIGATLWVTSQRIVMVTAALLVVIALGALTWRQCRVWHDSLTLWTHATTHGPPAASAHYNLACALAKSGDRESAIGEFHKSLEVNPVFASAHYNLSNTLGEIGRIDEAIAGYRRLLELNPDFGKAHYELGRIYAEQRRYREAKEEYLAAIRISPEHVKSYVNLGAIYGQQDKNHAAAIDLYRRALIIDPHHRDVHYNLGISLDATGRSDEAVLEYRAAIRIDPAYAEAHINLGNILARRGQTVEALAEYREALRIAPNHPAAKANYEGLLRHGKKN